MPKLHFSKADQEGLLRIAALLTNSTGWREDAYALAVYDRIPDGDEADRTFMRCIVVFQNRDARGADVHFAAVKKGWATRRLIGALLRYAFHPSFGGLKVIRAPIPEDNRQAMVAAIKAGFRIDGRLRAGAADGSDAIMFSLDAEERRLPNDDAPDQGSEQE